MKILRILGRIWVLLVPAIILLVSLAYAQAVSSSNYVKNISGGSQILQNHVPRAVALGLFKKLNPSISGQNIPLPQAFDLRVMLPSKDPAGMAVKIKQLYDPHSPYYHQFLSHQQVVQQFGASSVESTVVIEQLKSYGLNVYGQSDDGTILKVLGSSAAIKKAFNVNISNYKGLDGKIYFSGDTNPTLSPLLAGRINAIFGMDNTHRHYHHAHKNRISGTVITQAPKINVNAQTAKKGLLGFTGPYGTVAPSDILTAYNLNSVTSNGGGQTQALYELDGYLPGDVTEFTHEFHLSQVPSVSVVPIDGGITNSEIGAGDLEVDLDIDLTIAIAPGLSSILVYEADQNQTDPTFDVNAWVDEWNQIYSDDSAQIISCSWATDEPDQSYYDHSFFDKMALQGQTVFSASGDDGPYANCNNGSIPPSCSGEEVSVNDPASYPYVTGVGISILTVNGSQAWASETASAQGGGGISGSNTGPYGISWSIPSFQLAAATATHQNYSAGMVSITNRNVPDVVLTSDPLTSYFIYITDTSDSKQTGWYSVWGSSAATPIWAAFIARVNQGRELSGFYPPYEYAIGWLNPEIYQIAQTGRYSADFHDIHTTVPNVYYPPEPGFDDSTGLGSFNGANLYTDLLATAPKPPSTVNAIPGNTQATVSFAGASANGSAITGYTVTSSPGNFTNSGTISPITVSGLTNGQVYTFTVTATNALGTSVPSIASNSIIAGSPAPPLIVTAVAGDNQATVNYSGASANGSAITGYTATSSPGGGSGAGLGSASSIIVTNLINGLPYTFTVTAANSIGTGPASVASNSVTPLGPPMPPTMLNALPGNSGATVIFSGALPNGSAITGYTVTPSSGGSTGVGTTSPIFVSGLTNGTSYTFTVTATNMAGTGAASAVSNSIISGTPLPPTTVTAVAGNARAIVSYSGATANSSAITGYTVISSPGGLTGTGLTSPITVLGLTNNQPYTFTVTAGNSFGTGPASAASNSVTPTAVASPTNLKATILGARVGGRIIEGGVILTWSQSISPNIVQNRIYRSAGSGSYSLLAMISASTTFTDKNMPKGTTYNYKVTAYDSNSDESQPSSVVTLGY